MSNLSDFVGGRMVQKFQVLTSGTSWSLPANLLGDTVYISAIAGGEAYASTGPVGGDGGSYVIRHPYTVSTTVTYSIGAGGTGTSGANGGNTTWGTITLLGGGVTGATGCKGASAAATGFNANIPPVFGGNSSSAIAGGGLVFNGTLYGNGGASSDGGDGAILVEWWEKL